MHRRDVQHQNEARRTDSPARAARNVRQIAPVCQYCNNDIHLEAIFSFRGKWHLSLRYIRRTLIISFKTIYLSRLRHTFLLSIYQLIERKKCK